jgi:hypothetical protein
MLCWQATAVSWLLYVHMTATDDLIGDEAEKFQAPAGRVSPTGIKYF